MKASDWIKILQKFPDSEVRAMMSNVDEGGKYMIVDTHPTHTQEGFIIERDKPKEEKGTWHGNRRIVNSTKKK